MDIERKQERQQSIGGLWLKEKKDGGKYMSGSIEVAGQKVQIVIFRNTHKQEGEKTPDYRIYESKPREEGGWEKRPQAEAKRREVPAEMVHRAQDDFGNPGW